MKAAPSLHSEKKTGEPKAKYRRWQEAHNTSETHVIENTGRRIKKYQQTRWNRLSKMTLPCSLVILIKHKILALGTFAGALVSISLHFPTSYDKRYILAGGLALIISALPFVLKAITGFLFSKSWNYRRCVTPFVFLACAFSALPGFILLKEGAPGKLVTVIQSQSLQDSLENRPVIFEDELQKKQSEIDSSVAQLH